uniref:Acidic leucine-rich nuclear phosphoprotein 32 family member A n=1 Tax=Phallusia mammillata TaxID=59560 RepID=A0A6F9D5X4_9ASCI|nr:acidic leucine-rich nuclear phosphoprotein 32 family member A [Phallusia mammillata]
MLKRIQLECRGKSPEEVNDLNLDNCRCTGEPEGLTNEFKALSRLSMVKAGLTTLKGFPDLPNLERLDLSDNRISGTLSCLKGCTSLTHLNLSDNKIKTLDALETLGELPNLTNLDLTNCDVTKVPQYREEVFGLVSNLQFLDGYDANGQEAIDSEDDEADEEEENGQEENNVDGSEEDPDDEEEEEDDEDDVDDGHQLNPEVAGTVAANSNLNQTEDDDDDEDDNSDVDSDEEEEYDLAYIDGDDIQDDDEDDDDYEGGVEQEDEDIDEEDEDGGGESPRGVKRKHQEEEGDEGGDA